MNLHDRVELCLLKLISGVEPMAHVSGQVTVAIIDIFDKHIENNMIEILNKVEPISIEKVDNSRYGATYPYQIKIDCNVFNNYKLEKDCDTDYNILLNNKNKIEVLMAVRKSLKR